MIRQRTAGTFADWVKVSRIFIESDRFLIREIEFDCFLNKETECPVHVVYV